MLGYMLKTGTSNTRTLSYKLPDPGFFNEQLALGFYLYGNNIDLKNAAECPVCAPSVELNFGAETHTLVLVSVNVVSPVHIEHHEIWYSVLEFRFHYL